ncbi:MAG: DUF1345 domain-containing protein [Candidatus Saccharimonas sp.]
MKTIRSKRSRYLLALIAGGVAGIIAALYTKPGFVPIIAWDAAALVILAVIAIDMRGANSKMTSVVAKRDDMNHSLSDAIVILACLASLGAVIYLIMSNDASIAHIAFGLGSIVISWATVHTLYALRYAAIYYSDPEGGIDFNSREQPPFSDFLYLSYTVGMTYQVSDTNIKTSMLRKVILGHAVLSFVFGTAIIATTINFLVSLSK